MNSKEPKEPGLIGAIIAGFIILSIWTYGLYVLFMIF